MSIRVQCRCGKRLVAPESSAGKKGKCPACGAVFLVPQAPVPAERSAPIAQAVPKAAPRPAAAPVVPSQAALQLVPIAPDPACDERIVAALRSFLPQSDLHVTPDIPKKKVANAWVSCNIPADERILGLIDCTAFGSAKNALVFGRRAAYFHNDRTASCRSGCIPYDDLVKRTFSPSGTKQVSLGFGDQAIDASGCSCSPAVIATILREVSRAISGAPVSVAGAALLAVRHDGGEGLRPYVGDPGLVRLAAPHVPLEKLRMVGGAFWSTASTAAGRAAKTVLMNVVGGALLATVGIGFFGWAKKTRRAGILALTDDTLYVLDMGQIAGDDLTLHALKQMAGSPTVAAARLSDLAAASRRESGMGVLEITGPMALKAYFSDSCTDGNSSVAMNMALAIQAAGGSRVLGGASPQPRLPAPGGPPGVA